MALLLENISKKFTKVQAVDNLSMKVEQGDIFGFLGPNGAGKTTTIRIMLDILKPDAGKISWNGVLVNQVPRRFWGYLPEERGLYPKMTVEEQLIFLARLFGMPKEQARQKLTEWLERFQIPEYRKKRVEELSKGNQQKIQVVAAILHEPEILVMDEPFSGLDPLNVSILKDAFLELHHRGKTIIFSTHQMEQVEELCQNIVIINKGQAVVEGSVREVKQQSGRKVLLLSLADDSQASWLERVDGVKFIRRRADYMELHLAAGIDSNRILQMLLEHGEQITRFEFSLPSLNDIFIEKVTGSIVPKLSEPISEPMFVK